MGRNLRSSTASAARSVLTLLFPLVLATVPFVAAASLHTQGASAVQFVATGPMGLRIVGTTHDLVVADDGANVTVRVPLNHIVTGIGLRDQHLREHLDVAHFAATEIVVPRSAIRFPAGGSVATDVHGTMKLHGQSHDVRFHYTADPQGDAITVHATFRINFTTWGIEAPSYLGMTVRPDVDLDVRFTVKDVQGA